MLPGRAARAGGPEPPAVAVLAAKKLTDEDRRGLTALFWSNVNPYGTFRLDMDKRLELGLAAAVPGPRAPADAADRSSTETR